MKVKELKMKVVIQRVKNANVEISKKIVGSIDKGLVIFLGIKKVIQSQMLISL